MIYTKLIRPLLFLLTPEKIHSLMMGVLGGLTRLPGGYAFLSLGNHHPHKPFPFPFKHSSPVGLSAGFDKEGKVFDSLGALGFGFIEIGTITPDTCPGNPSPNIFRLPSYNSLITRTGFNNPGLAAVKKRLQNRPDRNYGLGINLNKNGDSTGEQAARDIVYLYKSLFEDADYFTVNCPSPDADEFRTILLELKRYRRENHRNKPVFIKLGGDITEREIQEIPALVTEYQIDGVIATGPVNNNQNLPENVVASIPESGNGSVCGGPVLAHSLEVVRKLRQCAGSPLFIIGAGGIITDEDAREMKKAGANMVQIYSAFIYRGPSVVRRISEVFAGEKNG